ncbi:MAG: helix-turn-helix transcriptional regulator [Bacteroidales bacterium]|nr:helix-turn-helix transcriptional regulator [Bacteroidales bacterium]MBR0083119.1 helix-turn-helix transcriptional regulator [Bacteroidales bacterium]
MENQKRIRLSEMEARVLRLITEGRTSQEIAEEVCLSLNTIKWYRKRLRIKFGAATTAQMISQAVLMDIVK